MVTGLSNVKNIFDALDSPRQKLQAMLLNTTFNRWLNSVLLIVLITSAEEGGYVFGSVCLSVCLSVRRITRKLVNGF